MADKHEVALPKVALPVARFASHEFEALTLVDFGRDAARRLVGRPLLTVSLFEDSATALPAIFLRFDGVPGVLADEGLLLSPRPTTEHPFATLDACIVSGASLDQIRYMPTPPADQQPTKALIDPAMAGRGDVVGQLRAFSMHLGAVAASLLSGAPLTPERRAELAGLLEPIIAAFEGSIRFEMAKRQVEQPTTQEGRP